MPVKTIPSSQIAPSNEIASQVEAEKQLDIEANGSSNFLPQCAEAVRKKLVASGISEKDVAAASAWARRSKD